MLQFDENGYRVSGEGVSVELLPKEFALLKFLYRGKGRAFSREQLLEGVWPLEYPVERTVDDHIYRLRKKLQPFSGIGIRTVRGFGYCLTERTAARGVDASPSSRDGELREKMAEVFAKYHQYGQGRSMLALARQQDVLGYELDGFYSVYIHFVEGDVEWLLRGEAPLAERLYSLLLFLLFTEEPEEGLAWCERVLEARILPPMQHRELEILNVLEPFAAAGRAEEALERLKLTREAIKEPGYENFETPVANAELYVHLMTDTPEAEMRRLIQRVETMIQGKPFLRDIGSCNLSKGLWKLKKNEHLAGEALIDEGLSVLELSGFVPMKLFALYRVRYFCRKYDFKGREGVTRKYESLFQEEQARCGLPGLKADIIKLLNDCLTL